jgi:hypothetical protein
MHLGLSSGYVSPRPRPHYVYRRLLMIGSHTPLSQCNLFFSQYYNSQDAPLTLLFPSNSSFFEQYDVVRLSSLLCSPLLFASLPHDIYPAICWTSNSILLNTTLSASPYPAILPEHSLQADFLEFRRWSKRTSSNQRCRSRNRVKLPNPKGRA